MSEIRLLGTKRIRMFSVGMLILIPSILFLYTLVIHYTMPNNLIVFFFLYSVFVTLFIVDIYLLFKTNDKLLVANLYVGISYFAFSLLTFCTFVFIIAKGRVTGIYILIGSYIIVGIIAELIIFKKKLFNFKQLGKISDSILLYMLGVGIGKGSYEFIKKAYGYNASDIMGIGTSFLLAIIFGFLGLFYINKYYIVSKYYYQMYVAYDE